MTSEHKTLQNNEGEKIIIDAYVYANKYYTMLQSAISSNHLNKVEKSTKISEENKMVEIKGFESEQ